MAREIKFRAWIKSVKAMSDWNTILKECDRFSLLHDANFELMQFTGLKDKTGKEIYEGDIVKTKAEQAGVCEWGELKNMTGFVFYVPGTMGEYFNPELCEFEVIGNIYENKELLEAKK